MESSTPAGIRSLKPLLAAGTLSLGGACAHNPMPATATSGTGSSDSIQLSEVRAASRAAGGEEQLEFVRNPQASRGWLIYGKETRRLIAVSDTVPDARGLFAIHFVGRK